MADKSEGAGNLDVQKSINDAIAARTALLSKQTDIMKGQVQLAVELCKAMKCEDLDSVSSRVQEITTSLGAAQKEAQNLEGKLTGVGGAAKGAAGGAGDMKKEVKGAAKEAKSFGDIAGEAFSQTMAQLDSIVELASSAGRGIFSIGQSILAIPLGIFNKLVGMAADLNGQIDPMRQALEDVRKAFGDLSKGEAAQTLSSFENISSQASNLAGSGLSLAKVYGMGREGLAAALKDLTATAEAMGPVFGALGDQFEENAASLLILQKGLGMTGEDMKAFGSYALATGQDVNDVLMETANLSLQMGEKFGISSKLIGKDMAYMTQNIGKFGSMTKTQMATATVYVRKLGLEIKDVEGLIGVFDDFEGAATAASKLAQAFGMNVDAMQMMQEQDPAKRLDSLRQAFAATGKSIETMSRQEKALLAQTAGLDENTVSLALSQENMGMSYDEIQKAAEESGDQQLSQAEIMQKTAENIERVVENLNKTTDSFLDTFLNGFMEGISRTDEFRSIIKNLASALRSTFQFGKDLGKMFVDMFPGIKDMAGGLADLFNPANFKAMLGKFMGAFKDFFKDLAKDPVKATENFMKKIQEIFFDKFNSESKNGQKFVEGLKKFGQALVGIIAGFGKMLIEGAAKAIKSLADFIRKPPDLMKGAKDMGGSILGPLIQVLKDAVPVLGAALLDLFSAIMVKFGPQIGLLVTGLLAFNLLKAFTGAVAQAAKAAVGEILKDKFLKMMGKTVADSATPAPGAQQGADGMNNIGKSIKNFVSEIAQIPLKDIGMATLKLVALAGMMLVGGVAFVAAAGVVGMTAMAVGLGTVLAGLAVVTLGALAAYATATIASKIQPGVVGQAAIGLLTASLLMLAAVPFVAATVLAAKVAEKASIEGIIKLTLIAGLALGAVAIAAYAATSMGSLFSLLPVIAAGLVVATVFVVALGIFALGFSKILPVFEKISIGSVLKAALVIGALAVAMAAFGVLGIVTAYASVGMAIGAVVFAALAGPVLGFIAGMALFGLAISAIGETVKIGSLLKASAALAVLGIAMVELGALGIITAYASVGMAIGAVFGLLLAGYVVAFLAGLSIFAETLQDFGAAVDTGALNKASLSLLAIGGAIASVALLLGELMLVGGVIISFGVLGAVAMVVGFAAVAGALAGIKEFIIPSITEISSAKIDTGKIGVVMDAITDLFAILQPIFGLFTAVLDFASPGFFGTVKDSAKAIGDILGPMNDFIKSVMGGLVDVIDAIIKAGKKAPSGKAAESKAKFMGSMISALGSLAGALMGPLSSLKAGKVDVGVFSTEVSESMADQIGAMQGFLLGPKGLLQSMVNIVPELIAAVLKGTSKFKGNVKDLKARGEFFATIVGAIANLGSTLLGAVSKVQPVVTTTDGILGDTTEVTVSMKSQLDDMKNFLLGSGGFLNALVGTVGPIMEAVDKATSSIKPAYMSTAKAKGELFATIIGAVANLSSSLLGSVAGVKPTVVKSEDLTSSEEVIATGGSMAEQLGTMKDFLLGPGGFLKALVGSIGEIMAAVDKSISATPGVGLETMKTKGEIFGAIIGAVASLASSLLGAVGDVKPIVTTTKESGLMSSKETSQVAVTMADQLNAMKDFLLGDGGFLYALQDALPPLVQSILGIEIPGDPETIKAKAEILASVVGMVGEMLGIFGKMMEMVGGEIVPGVQKDMATKMAELTLIMEQISPVFQSLSAPLGTLVSTFINAAALIPGDSKSVSESATKFSTVLEAVMGGISSLQKMWQDMTQAGGGDSATGVGVAFESIVATMSWADYAFTAITPYLINVSKQINDMAAGAGDATANIEKVSANIEGIIGIGSVLSRMQYSASAFADAAKVKISGDVKAIIDDIRQTNEALAELGEIDIYATIDKMGEALALKSEVLKIESKPIQMNVNINLTMKADDIAKEIMDVTAKTLKDKDKASDGMKELFPGMAI